MVMVWSSVVAGVFMTATLLKTSLVQFVQFSIKNSIGLVQNTYYSEVTEKHIFFSVVKFRFSCNYVPKIILFTVYLYLTRMYVKIFLVALNDHQLNMFI